MLEFRMSRLAEKDSRVEQLAAAMNRFELQPTYQRQSDVWGEDKRQLFIDSLINGYDVPKLYFHRLPPKSPQHPAYAIVDGKQRLEAIRAFLSNDFPLSEDFSDSAAESSEDLSPAAGKTYSELTRDFPVIASRLLRRGLDIVVIETSDIEIIEELFSRLNEAVPLNAPEKRNAFGGPIPPIIRRLVQTHKFFTDRLPIENTRYRQYDLVTKFLYLAQQQDFVAIKKRDLDYFVLSFRKNQNENASKRKALKLENKTKTVLNDMAKVFESQDDLLASVGLVTVYYMAFLLARKKENATLRKRLKRKRLEHFDQLRRHNRLVLRKQQAAIAEGRTISAGEPIRQDLAIFDRLMQSPNDGQALEYRFRILRAFLENRAFQDALPQELVHKMGDTS